jgi:hypothetical protein
MHQRGFISKKTLQIQVAMKSKSKSTFCPPKRTEKTKNIKEKQKHLTIEIESLNTLVNGLKYERTQLEEALRDLK